VSYGTLYTLAWLIVVVWHKALHFSALPCTSPSVASDTQGGRQAHVRPGGRTPRDARVFKRALAPASIRLRAALLITPPLFAAPGRRVAQDRLDQVGQDRRDQPGAAGVAPGGTA